MSKEKYDWKITPKIDKHSKSKFRVIGDYLMEYIRIRCQNFYMLNFNLVIVDGFSGGGFYHDPDSDSLQPGSPIIFIRSLRDALIKVNEKRVTNKLRLNCMLILNDKKKIAIEKLKNNVKKELLNITEQPELNIEPIFLNKPFENAIDEIKFKIVSSNYQNCIINLDQCGNKQVPIHSLVEFMKITNSVEIFFTFMIGPLITYLNKKNKHDLMKQLEFLQISFSDIDNLFEGLNESNWRGYAEKFVFQVFCSVSKFITSFSVYNPNGWKYWFIHFSNILAAKEAIVRILHKHSSTLGHYGKPGIDMFNFNPRLEYQDYLFEEVDRDLDYQYLMDDLPRLLENKQDYITIGNILGDIYNTTAASRESICKAILNSKDIILTTKDFGSRRKPNAVKNSDLIIRNRQRFFIYD